MKLRPATWILVFALVAMFGYWLARTAVPEKEPRASADVLPETPRAKVAGDEEMPKFRRGDRPPAGSRDRDALNAGALEGQRVLVFKDQDALNRFLKNAGNGIRILGRLDALNALRVGFSDYKDLAGLLDGEEESSFIFPVSTPPLPDGSVQPGAVALGSRLHEWLGISKGNSGWGQGVTIAILDTGVFASSAFSTSIQSINLVDLPSDLAKLNGHGTAVASMISGSDPLTPGVAPGAKILSVRVANDLGESDSFLLAEGIVAAVDAGASLINISMGGFGDSALLKNAVQYALDRGVLILAAPGNNGVDQVALPAGYPGVIAPAAVDALGNHLDFSNSGSGIDIAAPGYGINAAWTGDEPVSVTGTSFSTPIVAGVVAAVMTEAGPGTLTPAQAWQLVVSYLNDGGAAGDDPQLGAGMPDIGRILSGETSGIYDAALASQRILPPDAGHPYGQVEILIQNRGTEALVNTTVKVSTGAAPITNNITTLVPNAVTTFRVPISRPPATGSEILRVDSQVSLSGGVVDAKPSNDRRIESYAPVDSP